ncbi:MAG: hypothetical protein A2504_15135 [Bdellovibrionales bacterium RIFOXYD12_FULL_39_22]|nr:MAG: hypothetical protein A2385_02565 [Bdellovibrionales bacterium RIFOXYB1_FULL_39_21]OFZ43130.1 MAG: hypothetical protein A2485_11710 [Bdellovibrionales bacterium RIFOXYC12_FULL_39_17]OFZ47868.1 MAG: hypothetical protein A2404_16350 [Bdellovibrionales bacterium RIFOXYC1_FULL_39_130]OFZ75648.1 MAG: hypothetical protein A2560_12850 [Bdellovibrionales bacterium RIFOXYD1_FULL_39_84]OFZ94138.1 MAG: hypothetical protein A2504_15135 [Bdellovibrionales bacterium RIFOXYD12_FULL_39_22]HLE11797.1 hy
MNRRITIIKFCGHGEELKVFLHKNKDGLFFIPQFAGEQSLIEVLHFRSENELPATEGGGDFYPLLTVERLVPTQGGALTEALSQFWPFLKNFSPVLANVEIPRQFLSRDLRDKLITGQEEIVFFGGAFNPLHNGHLECLRQSPNKNVVVIPDKNPWKEESGRTAEKDHGCAWQAYLNLSEKLKTTSGVYPGFIGKKESNPTVSWIDNVVAKRRALLIGDDNFMNFERWTGYKKVLRSIQALYVVPRLFKHEELVQKRSMLLQENGPIKIDILQEHSYQQLSSSALRRNEVS